MTCLIPPAITPLSVRLPAEIVNNDDYNWKELQNYQ